MTTEPREPPDHAPLPERIGPYRILQKLGHGGMGEVFQGRHDQLHTLAAVKVIKLGMDSREVLRRFELERQTLALMDHHNIARVLDAGIEDSGRPWFAMEYVPGLPLTEYCDLRQMPLRDRLALFLQVCDAVQHAHGKGVIHRDLTPRNILVREEGDQAVPKVIDFGLARAVNLESLRQSLITEHGQILGTPEYMSPEQAEAGPTGLDIRTDVYALGAILYELLVGQHALEVHAAREAGLLEVLRRIREVEPQPPSVRLSSPTPGSELHAQQRSTTTIRLRRDVHGDLDWITLKALEKDRRRRYQTVQALADDLRNHLGGLPVSAGPPTARYRIAKWVRRHRLLVAAGTAITASVLGGATLAFLGWQAAERARAAERLLADDLLAPALQEQAETLWPLDPHELPRFDAWLEQARGLVARLPAHRQRPGPTLPLVERLAAPLTERRAAVANIAFQEAQRARAAAAWRPSPDQLAERWRTVRAALAGDARVPPLPEVLDQRLLPLRPSPQGLWEFLVLGTGAEPQPDGAPRPQDGIVLVLLPSGECWFGAQHRDPQAPNWLPGPVSRNESDTAGRAVRLRVGAFFLGKHEVTQAQWLRLTGNNPSQGRKFEPGDHPPDPLQPEDVSLRPVENVSARLALTVLARVGLELPTEGQWEYACRGGAPHRWPWGDDDAALGRHANFADADCARKTNGAVAAARAALERGIDDGFLRTAPVGRFLPNAFGLHDMLGNVAEWTFGGQTDDLGAGVREGDGMVLRADGLRAEDVATWIHRGGHYTEGLDRLRPSARNAYDRENRHPTVGVRAALLMPGR